MKAYEQKLDKNTVESIMEKIHVFPYVAARILDDTCNDRYIMIRIEHRNTRTHSTCNGIGYAILVEAEGVLKMAMTDGLSTTVFHEITKEQYDALKAAESSIIETLRQIEKE